MHSDQGGKGLQGKKMGAHRVLLQSISVRGVQKLWGMAGRAG